MRFVSVFRVTPKADLEPCVFAARGLLSESHVWSLCRCKPLHSPNPNHPFHSLALSRSSQTMMSGCQWEAEAAPGSVSQTAHVILKNKKKQSLLYSSPISYSLCIFIHKNRPSPLETECQCWITWQAGVSVTWWCCVFLHSRILMQLELMVEG